MNLQRISILNFKGIKSLTLTPNGEDLYIHGDNYRGKTSVADAYMWVLTGKDSKQRSPQGFNIKRKEEGETIHKLTHSVELVFNNITLKKTYKERWATPRGQAEEELKGHSTTYYVDRAKKKKRAFQMALAEVLSPDKLKLLSTPHYFAQHIDKDERRDVLVGMAENVSTSDVTDYNPDVSEYPDIIGDMTHADKQEILGDEAKEAKRKMDEFPTRISETRSQKHEIGDVDAIRDNLSDYNEQIDFFKEDIEALRNASPAATIKAKRQDLKQQMIDAQQEAAEEVSGKTKSVRKNIAHIEGLIDEVLRRINKGKRLISEKQETLKVDEDKGRVLHAKIKDIRSIRPVLADDYDGNVCSSCGQEVPDGVPYEEYKTIFNIDRAEKIEQAEKREAALRENLKGHKAEVKRARETIDKLKSSKQQYQTTLEEKQKELADIHQSSVDLKDTPAYKKLHNTYQNLSGDLEDAQQDLNERLASVKESLQARKQLSAECRVSLQQAEENKEKDKRIQTLKDTQREHAKAYQDIQQQLMLMEAYRVSQGELITQSANKKFKNMSWELFQPQLNGGFKRVCRPIWQGRDFTDDLSSSEQIMAGCDIVEGLSDYWGTVAPMIIDNAECMAPSRLTDRPFQIIGLVFDERYDELTPKDFYEAASEALPNGEALIN
jgi:DNA repair exonuclease SbcCD ATPase subunit